MNWISENLPSLGVLGAVLLLLFGLVLYLVKMKRSAKGGCAGCAFAGKCSGGCSAKNLQNKK